MYPLSSLEATTRYATLTRSALRALFDYVGDKTYGRSTGEIPVSSCWIAARINRIAHGCIMA